MPDTKQVRVAVRGVKTGALHLAAMGRAWRLGALRASVSLPLFCLGALSVGSPGWTWGPWWAWAVALVGSELVFHRRFTVLKGETIRAVIGPVVEAELMETAPVRPDPHPFAGRTIVDAEFEDIP